MVWSLCITLECYIAFQDGLKMIICSNHNSEETNWNWVLQVYSILLPESLNYSIFVEPVSEHNSTC